MLSVPVPVPTRETVMERSCLLVKQGEDAGAGAEVDERALRILVLRLVVRERLGLCGRADCGREAVLEGCLKLGHCGFLLFVASRRSLHLAWTGSWEGMGTHRAGVSVHPSSGRGEGKRPVSAGYFTVGLLLLIS